MLNLTLYKKPNLLLKKVKFVLNLFFIMNNYFKNSQSLKFFIKELLSTFKIVPKTYLLSKNFTTHTEFNSSIVNTNLKKKHKIQKFKKLFLIYNNINTFLHQKSNIPHYSFSALYILNNHSNLGYFNFKKVFNVWVSFTNFIKNIFFYDIKFNFFSSNYFKYENLTLNFNFKKAISSSWKFNYPFIFFLNNKTTLYNDAFFYKLSQKHYKSAFVIDIYYHKKTLYYLNKYKFITIGPVPISSNFYSLTLGMPVASNSVFSNLFFVRLILKLRKISLNKKFLSYKYL